VTTISGRDLKVLRFLCEQFAAPLEVIREVLHLERATTATTPGGGWRTAGEAPDRLRMARKWTARMEAGAYVRRERLPRGVWVVPMTRGLALAAPDDGEPYEVWHLRDTRLAHVEAVERLRLHLEREHPGARWECERAIRRRHHHAYRAAGINNAVVRFGDGALLLGDGAARGRRVGVEVELHVKAAQLYRGIVRDQDPRCSEVWWFARPGSVSTLRGRLDTAGAINHHVRPLPFEVRP
jgi:hypothetical protein